MDFKFSFAFNLINNKLNMEQFSNKKKNSKSR